jgi:3',5'-cyclic AMP phosphodiesterase CpdA
VKNAGGESSAAHREAVEPLAAVVHITDPHICDPLSPARLEYLDGTHLHHQGRFVPLHHLYRPHEVLQAHAFAASLARIAEKPVGPATGVPLDALILGGDSADNSQANELELGLGLLAGGTCESLICGDELRDFMSAAQSAGWGGWDPESSMGPYPPARGLADAASRPIASPGTPLPWVGLLGNHDCLILGWARRSDGIRLRAVGSEKIVAGRAASSELIDLIADPSRVLPEMTMSVRSRPGRAALDPERLLDQMTLTTGVRRAERSARPGDFVWDLRGVRFLALNTVHLAGGPHGMLSSVQLDWADERLGEWPGLCVLLTHHGSAAVGMEGSTPGPALPPLDPTPVLDRLLRHDHLICWLNGHGHAGSLRAHDRGAARLWEITTPAIGDWPCQLHVIEISLDAQGDLVIHVTPVDASRAVPGIESGESLAGLHRELALIYSRSLGTAGAPREASSAVLRRPAGRAAGQIMYACG